MGLRKRDSTLRPPEIPVTYSSTMTGDSERVLEKSEAANSFTRLECGWPTGRAAWRNTWSRRGRRRLGIHWQSGIDRRSRSRVRALSTAHLHPRTACAQPAEIAAPGTTLWARDLPARETPARRGVRSIQCSAPPPAHGLSKHRA